VAEVLFESDVDSDFVADGEGAGVLSPDEVLPGAPASEPELSVPAFPSVPESPSGFLPEPPERLSVL